MKSACFVIFVLIFTLISKAQDQKYIDSLYHQLKSLNEDTAKINMLNKIASELQYVNQEQIHAMAQQALNLSIAAGYKSGIAEAYYNIGNYYRLKSVYDPAIEYAFKSMDLMEQTENKGGIGRCYNLIGIIYYYLQNYSVSLDYFTKALQISVDQKDKKWIAGNYNNIGLVYEHKGSFDKSLEYYLKALEINIELNNKNWIATNYANIGSLYQSMGNPKCLEYFFKRLNLKKEINDAAGIAVSEYLIGKYFNSQKQFSEALPYLEESLKLNDSVGSLLQATRISNELSITYAGLKNFENAYKFHQLYKRLDDSLNFEENTQKITRLEMQHGFKKDQTLTDIKNQKSFIIRTAIGVCLIFLIILTILLINRQKAKANHHKQEEKKLQLENKLMQEELLFKDKLLQDNIDYLVTKNNLIASVSEKLISRRPSFNLENQHLINEIVLELQVGMENDLWEEFELTFNQVHSDFYKNLNLKLPLLSSSEKKLCAFLRLNMTTREIAAITRQSVSSIETARTRLRKKLNLANSEITLQEYMKQF
ncbi:MAG: tetratricopeptide repeat protein [Bacteroidetes bacterium]|nr:tetratricopeptide repeat protein [Bacteroidota bacterium]